jgi:hypothetical protein
MTKQAPRGRIVLWRFYDYMENKRNFMEEWLRGRDEVRAEFDTVLS